MSKLVKNLLTVLPFILCFGLFSQSFAQGKIVASIDFKPTVNGFSFPNYKNEAKQKKIWENDVVIDDLIRMFGIRASCKNGNDGKPCIAKADARTWMAKQLKAMNIGHCEGIGVASLRFLSGMPFKNRRSPAHFQANAAAPFNLRLEQNLRNYISYYWITQTFDEVSLPTVATAKKGALGVVQMLIEAMNNRSETYLLGIWKYKNGTRDAGHAVTPFAVEDAGNQYKIHVYDNNYPKETRFVWVNKDAPHRWNYTAGKNPNGKPEYVGDNNTKTIELTATSWRDNKCFDVYFAEDKEEGCGAEAKIFNPTIFTKASYQPKLFVQDEDGEDAEFFLTGEGDLFITDGRGRRIGYNPFDDRFYNEIPDGNPQLLKGGFGIDLPHFTFPYEDTGEPYKIVFSGENLEQESTMDFVFAAPGFVVGFNDLRLDPDEILEATISFDGEEITFSGSADGETPEVFYAFDDDENPEKASYITRIDGVELFAGENLSYNFDFENLKLYFSDDDGNEDEYDLDLIRINADGSEDVYEQNDLNIGTADSYEMDFGDWKGNEDTMCFRDDDDGDKDFTDEECEEQSNEDDGVIDN
jgi:hypothetical protein